VAYVVRSWPRLSQTFVLNEVLAVERAGVDLEVFALARSDDDIVQPEVADVRASVTYLGERGVGARVAAHVRAFVRSPRRYVTTALMVARTPRLDEGYRNSTRWGCLDAAVELAARLRATRVEHVHAHFAHDPTLVAQLAHRLGGPAFTFTAHARDLYQIPPASLAERVHASQGVVTCCAVNAEHVRAVVGDAAAAKVRLVHHGIALDELRPADPAAAPRRAVPLVLSIGRLVEKKGFGDLLTALAKVAAAGHDFRCEIHGEGPDRDALVTLARELDLDARVSFPGARARRELLDVYRRADVFALTPFVTDDGDRDGIPNVLLEAMAFALPVVTTEAGGIAELVTDGANGSLLAPRDVDGVAAAIAALLTDPACRARFGAAGRATVEAEFYARSGL
jgi:glycosyltransferase involved in cell wall biosynthesis